MTFAVTRCECTGQCGADHPFAVRVGSWCDAVKGDGHPLTSAKVVLKNVALADGTTKKMCQTCRRRIHKIGDQTVAGAGSTDEDRSPEAPGADTEAAASPETAPEPDAKDKDTGKLFDDGES